MSAAVTAQRLQRQPTPSPRAAAPRSKRPQSARAKLCERRRSPTRMQSPSFPLRQSARLCRASTSYRALAPSRLCHALTHYRALASAILQHLPGARSECLRRLEKMWPFSRQLPPAMPAWRPPSPSSISLPSPPWPPKLKAFSLFVGSRVVTPAACSHHFHHVSLSPGSRSP